MSLVYFETERGVLVLDRARIIGAQQNRVPTDYPTRVLVDNAVGHFDVRNSFDDVQRTLQAADRPPEADTLDKVRAAVQGYYDALSARQHGGVAQNKAFEAIQVALGMRWNG